MSDDEHMSRISRRFNPQESEDSESTETSDETGKNDTSEKSDKSDTTESASAEELAFDSEFADVVEHDTNVRDRPSRLLYLPEPYTQELRYRYQELNARYVREHDEELGKNRAFYPAVIKAGLESGELPKLLGLDDGESP